MPATVDRPLLGVAGPWGSAEIELAHRFDDLHQLVYRRGGIRSSNAAVEEVAKLILIRLWSLRTGTRQPVTVADCRAAFAAALKEPSLVARDAAGDTHPIWPLDEPFRLADPTVLDAATTIVEDTIRLGSTSVADPLGTAFDALLAGRYDHTGGLGTYLTPSGVARMMAEVGLGFVAATAEDGVPGFGDPFCGTGRFLVAALAALPHDHPLRTAGPFGADQSAAAVAKARINMLLYGVDRPLIWTVRDSVTDAGVSTLLGRVPLILTNPPFGDGQYDDPEGVAATVAALPGLAARRRIDPSLACLVRSLRLLAPGGVLGIVLPDGIVGSDAFGELVFGPAGSARDGFISLAASVSLPTSTFALSGTVAKTTAVFLRRNAPVSRVALARVEHVGYLRQAGRAAPDPAGDELLTLPSLIAAALGQSVDDQSVDGQTSRKPAGGPTIANLEPLVAVAPTGSVRSLDPAGLDPVAMGARQRLVAAGGVELGSLLSAAASVRAKKITTPFVSVLHIDDLGGVDWPAAHAHTPTTTGLLAPPGSLIVSLLNPSRLRAAVIPAGGEPLQVSAEFGVFTARCDPHAILALLYSPDVRAQLRPLGSGTSSSRRRITTADVLALIVPALPDERLAALGAEVHAATALVTTGRERLAAIFTAPARPPVAGRHPTPDRPTSISRPPFVREPYRR